MRVTVRLYKRYDLDLIAISTGPLSIGKIAKRALLAYVEGEPLKLKLSRFAFNGCSEEEDLKYEYAFVLNHKSEIECKAIDFLNSIKRNRKNAFIKALIRGCLDEPVLSVYLKNPAEAKLREHLFRKTYVSEDIPVIPENQVSFNDSVEKSGDSPKENDINITADICEKADKNGMGDITYANNKNSLADLTTNNDIGVDIFSIANEMLANF